METKINEVAVAAAGLQPPQSIFDNTSLNKLAEIYSDWSEKYERHGQVVNYNGPNIAAEEVTGLVDEKQRKQVRILDVGAGTGCVGRKLSKYGFTNIDALEPSEGMMKILSDTDHYNLKYLESVGFGQSSVPQATYDLVITVGAMAPCHIPLAGLDDMIRFTKSGGLVVIVMRREFLETSESYRGKLEPYMDQLEQKGLWRKESRKLVPNYRGDKEGLVFVYRVN